MNPTLPAIVVDPVQQAFGDLLYGAAERLVDSMRVLDVRVLQGGSVVTGTVSADAPSDQRASRHRVYIRVQNTGSQKIAGECSCGERSPCVHVVAVVIAAARSERNPAGDSRLGGVAPAYPRPANGRTQNAPALQHCLAEVPTRGTSTQQHRSVGAPTHGAPTPQQRLYYLFERLGAESDDLDPDGKFHVTVWVAQTESSGGPLLAASVCPYAPRFPRGPAVGLSSGISMEFPRYVDAQDREILGALTAQHAAEPWALRGASGADLLQRAVATGRAFWKSLHGQVLRAGKARRVQFAWRVQSDGNQRLRCESFGSLDILLGTNPPMYIDPATNESGAVELPCSVDLLRRYGNRCVVAPEETAAMNERIAHDAGNATFPLLRSVVAQRQALTALRGRLVLSAEPQAILYFLYNGLSVDSRMLDSRRDSVRQMAGDVLYEVGRDRDAERHLQSRLGRVLQATPDSRAAWLTFMLNEVPALKAEGWEVSVEDDFPYRVVAPSEWYGDLESDRQPGWFNLRLGVVVDGRAINLLPALTRYLQSSLEDAAGAEELAAPGAGDERQKLRLLPRGLVNQRPQAARAESAAGDFLQLKERATEDAAGCRIGEHWLVRLDDGRYLPVGLERIQRIANTLVELFDRDSLNTQQALSLPSSQTGRLAQLTGELNGQTLRSDDPSLRSLIADLEGFSGIRPLPAPAHFQGTLRPYQEEGLGWLQFLRRYRLGGILADDMGLGKTIQTIAHIGLEFEQGRLHKPALIVAPVSAMGNWQQEFRRFAPGLNVLTWHGSQRRKSLPVFDQAQVIITAYPLLLVDSEILLARDFGLVILDEAQTIKNPRAKVSQIARALRAGLRLCLTGTPVENHLGELWSLFDFLQPGLLGDERHFQRHYRTPIEKNGNRLRAQALSARLGPFLLRRTKDSVAKELPPKVEIVENILLDERQRDFYDGIRLAMHQRIQEVIREQGLARSQITILDALLKLRQVCCDPRLVEVGTANEAIPSAKLDWLCTVLPELLAAGRRILLFSQFTSMLRLIEAAVTALSIPYCLLTGDTRDRTAVVARFQSGAVPLFLISLKAGGTALNLTAADTVIHYDPWWNPAVEAQATDRAHRIGQTRSIFVYKLIAQDTVEERMMQLQADKRVLADRLYTEKTAAPTALGAADLEMLFAP